MVFQQAVQFFMGLGVPGELYDDGPHRALPYTLVSADATYNVFGRAFSVTSEGIAAAGNTGTAVFAGILINPKSAALLGDSTGTLTSSLALPNNALGQLLIEGEIVVTLPAAAAIGDLVIYDNTTGILSTITPATALPVGKSSAYAVVDRFTVSGAGLAVIRVLDVPKIPT